MNGLIARDIISEIIIGDNLRSLINLTRVCILRINSSLNMASSIVNPRLISISNTVAHSAAGRIH